MKNNMLAITAALFAVIFVFGCIGGGGDEDTGAGAGYSLAINPSDVIAGGIVTVDLRLTNVFENDMENVAVDIKRTGIPSNYEVTGSETGLEITSGQEFPVIMNIEVPESAFAGTINPEAEVCFDYTLDYFFDVAVKNKTKASEDVTLTSASESGPFTVSTTGLETIFKSATGKNSTGILTISNSWQGEIKEIKSVTATAPSGGQIDNMQLVFSNCAGNIGTTTSISSDVSNADCNKRLTDENVIKRSISPKLVIDIDDAGETTSIERIQGNVGVNYCYDVPLGTISVTTVD